RFAQRSGAPRRLVETWTSALETRAPQGGPERPRDGRWRAGDVAQVVGWRGMYPDSKLYADFGHFSGVSQWRHSFDLCFGRTNGLGDPSPVIGRCPPMTPLRSFLPES